eukprot:TRINITY_DN2440_c0_g1_i1.p1 TRINITY_DN2440_c0_g1~~TRINITY_DN2440_c0_g1_i1.p1  ORF type:complete len:350 (-),score=117.04 TRINITY_DN2440_c0_g1_i1:75-1028(-)
MMKLLVFVAFFVLANAQINVNFAGMFSGSAILPPTTCTNLTCKPFLSLRRALDAAHVRVAQKGLWTKIYVTDNDQWPSITYDGSCPAADFLFPFPPKEGAFAALLNKGLRIAYPDGQFAFVQGQNNPPTGIDINYVNAVLAELRTNYGPISATWVPIHNWTSTVLALANGDVDLTIPHSLFGYIYPNVFTPETRADTKLAGGCPAYIFPDMAVVRSSSALKSFSDLSAAGANLKVGWLGSNSPTQIPLLPLAKVVTIPDEASFTDAMDQLINGKIDLIYDAVVVATDVAGTPYKLEQFLNIPSGNAAGITILTPIDK